MPRESKKEENDDNAYLCLVKNTSMCIKKIVFGELMKLDGIRASLECEIRCE